MTALNISGSQVTDQRHKSRENAEFCVTTTRVAAYCTYRKILTVEPRSD